MTIRIHIPTPLRRYSNNEPSVIVSGTTVGEALDDLFQALPSFRIRTINEDDEIHPYLIVMVGDDEVPRDAWREVVLDEDDEIDIIPAVEGGSDVRMKGFRDRSSVARAKAWSLDSLTPRFESVSLSEMAGRVLGASVTSTVDVPPFDRSAMDGFAVVAEDTFGATPYAPITLTICGESMPGCQDLPQVHRGQACRIMTGAPMPPGANAVLMAEDCQAKGGILEAYGDVSPKKNVGKRAEDIAQGQEVLRKGRRLRPQDVGLLASIGQGEATVFSQPRVSILVTGNELLAPGETPRSGFIVDSNSPMLAALVGRDGGVVEGLHRLPDDRDEIRAFLSSLSCDVLLCAGGSSVGREDFLPLLVAELGTLPIHGVAMRPSAPTGLGAIDGVPVFLLPGNPVSCLCAYDHFAGPALRTFSGRDSGWPYESKSLVLSRRISSQIGRHDYVRVAVDSEGCVAPIALSGASLLSSTTQADGFVLVSEDSEGVDEGQKVVVYLYDRFRA